jgi:hypothetical protein
MWCCSFSFEKVSLKALREQTVISFHNPCGGYTCVCTSDAALIPKSNRWRQDEGFRPDK